MTEKARDNIVKTTDRILTVREVAAMSQYIKSQGTGTEKQVKSPGFDPAPGLDRQYICTNKKVIPIHLKQTENHQLMGRGPPCALQRGP